MAGFKVNRDINDRPLRVLPVTSATYAVGDLVELAAGATTWAKVTSSSLAYTRKAIAMAAGTSVTTLLCMELVGSEEVQVESANTANAAHNGDRMLFTDENTVNNTGTDNTTNEACFVQTGVAGTTQITGYVLVGSGSDPLAT